MWPVTAAGGVLCNLIAGDQGGGQGGGQGGDQAVTAHSTSHINQHKPGPAPAKITRSDSTRSASQHRCNLIAFILPQMGEVLRIISQHLSALKIKTTIKLRLAYQWYQVCTSWSTVLLNSDPEKKKTSTPKTNLNDSVLLLYIDI